MPKNTANPKHLLRNTSMCFYVKTVRTDILKGRLDIETMKQKVNSAPYTPRMHDISGWYGRTF